jgi:hypothetical protein
MKPVLNIIISGISVFIFSCSSPSNERAVSIDELDKVQAAEKAEMDAVRPTRPVLTAVELVELADCGDLPCIQLYMKDRNRDFIHAKKGEFASQMLATVKDTSGAALQMPFSTFYVATEPQASWRAAHTIHDEELGNKLFAEFHQLGFKLVDSGNFLGLKNIQQRFASDKYPGKNLYVTSTFAPWYLKGLYNRKVTWPCYVFEVYKN